MLISVTGPGRAGNKAQTPWPISRTEASWISSGFSARLNDPEPQWVNTTVSSSNGSSQSVLCWARRSTRQALADRPHPGRHPHRPRERLRRPARTRPGTPGPSGADSNRWPGRRGRNGRRVAAPRGSIFIESMPVGLQTLCRRPRGPQPLATVAAASWSGTSLAAQQLRQVERDDAGPEGLA